MLKLKVITLFTFTFLTGCDLRTDWEKAPREYKCTLEQMEVVKEQAKWCDDNTDYHGRYCYGTAIMRNCIKGGE